MIILAPMEGVFDSITRSIYSEIGGYDRLVTEFIRVSDLTLPKFKFYQYCPELNNNGKTPTGTPVFVQLLGGKPEVIAENAKLACDLGAPGIDLNFGCPAPTVNKNDGGATLLKNPHRLYDVVNQVRKALSKEIPVTAKVRLGFSDKNSVVEIAKAVESGGAALMTVHARTRDERYLPPAHWEFIRIMKEAVQIPVAANGDIFTVADYQRCIDITDCEHIALGRGAFADPFLALKIKAFQTQQHSDFFMSAETTKNILKKFIQKAQELQKSESFTVNRVKQWSKYLDAKSQNYLFEKIKKATTLSEIDTCFEADSYGAK